MSGSLTRGDESGACAFALRVERPAAKTAGVTGHRWRLLVVAAFLATARAQTGFDAASVKPVPEGVGAPRAGYWVGPRMDSPQRFRARTYVQALMEWAYQVRDFQIVGGPQWIREVHSRFEIQAMSERPMEQSEMRRMVQALLSERFQLRLHRETREIPVYVLVVGKNGPKLPVSKDVTEGDGTINIGQGRVVAQGLRMGTFVRILSDNLEHPAMDRTNLTGRYDFVLNYDPSLLADWRLGPALFGMVQDLGLRLERRREMVEMLVIDSIEQPSGN